MCLRVARLHGGGNVETTRSQEIGRGGWRRRKREKKKREKRKEEPFVITNESRENAQVVFSTSQYHLVAEHGSNLEPKTKLLSRYIFDETPQGRKTKYTQGKKESFEKVRCKRCTAN